MDLGDVPGSSGIKKTKTISVNNPKKLAAFANLSSDEDSIEEAVSTEDERSWGESGDSSESENDEIETNNGSFGVLMNNDNAPHIIWSDPPLINRKQLLFLEPTGLKQQPAGNTPIDYFNLLVDDRFYDLIVEQTNMYAEEVFLSSGGVRARITDWKPISKDELIVFLGLILHTGTIKINRLQDYWKKHWLFNFTCFADCMGRNRFLLILRCLHFANNPIESQVTPNDKLYKIRPIINYFNEKMLEVYNPDRELVLDESMIAWRVRFNFRQYLPEKRHKYDIKCYILAEPNGLTLKLMVYTGTKDMIGGLGHASAVVLHLMEERLDKGHSLFMDNFYCSHYLASTLVRRNTYCTGTLRSNRENNCVDVKEKVRKGEVIAKCDELNSIIMAKWHDKRDVTFISTEYSATLMKTANKYGQIREKPEAIIQYNKCMSGVDRKDQMLAYNACDRNTLRWYKKTAIYTLQILLLNSWLFYNKYSGKRMSFYDFRLIIIENLLAQKIQKPQSQKSGKPSGSDHLPSKLHKSGGKVQRKDCRICKSKNSIRRMTNYCCSVCPGSPGLCLEPCFKIWHDK